jgi:hypothetical protein
MTTEANRSTLQALLRAERGLTSCEATHTELLTMGALVTHLGTEIRRAGSKQTFCKSAWELTESGFAELRRLRALLPHEQMADELPTYDPASVLASERVSEGVYRVKLGNGAKATVAKADQFPTLATGPAKGWGWQDRRGGVVGLDSKRDAITSFRHHRG